MRIIVGLVAAFLLFTSTSPAEAQRHRPTEPFSSQDTFGLGIMLGGPTGLNGKYYLGPDTAVDFGVGAYHRVRFHSAIQLHADFLWHPFNLVSDPVFDLPLYFGIGGRILFHEFDPDEDRDDDVHLGVRGPVGLAMIFNEVPVDIFLELALVLDIVVDEDEDLLFADFNALVGARYYFY